jgi:hypothetical protein
MIKTAITTKPVLTLGFTDERASFKPDFLMPQFTLASISTSVRYITQIGSIFPLFHYIEETMMINRRITIH